MNTSVNCVPGTTLAIVFTTHYLDEADQLAERVVVIDYGTIIAVTLRNESRIRGRPHHATFDRADDASGLFGLMAGRKGAGYPTVSAWCWSGGSPAWCGSSEEADHRSLRWNRRLRSTTCSQLDGRSLRDAAASEPALPRVPA